MGLVLIICGILIWALVSPLIGIIMVVAGIILLFVPGTAGYSDWHGRHRGPP
jgi:hypothetical protein